MDITADSGRRRATLWVALAASVGVGMLCAMLGLFRRTSPSSIPSSDVPPPVGAARERTRREAAPSARGERGAPVDRTVSARRQPSFHPGPKFSEPRVPFERAGSPSVDGDPGPGPYLLLYQGRSGRLSGHALPHLDRAPDATSSAAKGPELVVWAESTRVTAGERAVIHATLADGSGRAVEPEVVDIQLSATGDAGPAPSVRMAPSPAGTASQFYYAQPTAALRSTAGKATPPTEYRFTVQARGRLGGEDFERIAGGFFWVQSPGARLDRASAATDVRRGNLELDVVVNVERAGTYFVSAELWGGPNGAAPIAFARERLERLQPGARHVTLLFGGKIVRDSGVDGPYTVRNLRLLQVDAVPPHEAEQIDDLPPTRAMNAADFY